MAILNSPLKQKQNRNTSSVTHMYLASEVQDDLFHRSCGWSLQHRLRSWTQKQLKRGLESEELALGPHCWLQLELQAGEHAETDYEPENMQTCLIHYTPYH